MRRLNVNDPLELSYLNISHFSVEDHVSKAGSVISSKPKKALHNLSRQELLYNVLVMSTSRGDDMVKQLQNSDCLVCSNCSNDLKRMSIDILDDAKMLMRNYDSIYRFEQQNRSSSNLNIKSSDLSKERDQLNHENSLLEEKLAVQKSSQQQLQFAIDQLLQELQVQSKRISSKNPDYVEVMQNRCIAESIRRNDLAIAECEVLQKLKTLSVQDTTTMPKLSLYPLFDRIQHRTEKGIHFMILNGQRLHLFPQPSIALHWKEINYAWMTLASLLLTIRQRLGLSDCISIHSLHGLRALIRKPCAEHLPTIHFPLLHTLRLHALPTRVLFLLHYEEAEEDSIVIDNHPSTMLSVEDVGMNTVNELELMVNLKEAITGLLSKQHQHATTTTTNQLSAVEETVARGNTITITNNTNTDELPPQTVGSSEEMLSLDGSEQMDRARYTQSVVAMILAILFTLVQYLEETEERRERGERGLEEAFVRSLPRPFLLLVMEIFLQQHPIGIESTGTSGTTGTTGTTGVGSVERERGTTEKEEEEEVVVEEYYVFSPRTTTTTASNTGITTSASTTSGGEYEEYFTSFAEAVHSLHYHDHRNSNTSSRRKKKSVFERYIQQPHRLQELLCHSILLLQQHLLLTLVTP